MTTSVSLNQRKDADLEEILLQPNGFLSKISTNFCWWYTVWFSSLYVIMGVRVSVIIIVEKKSIELIQYVKNPCCLDCLASKGKSRIDIFGNGK